MFLGKVQLPAGCCTQRWAAGRDDYRHRAPGGANLLFWSSSGPVLLHNIGLLWPHAQCAHWHWKVNIKSSHTVSSISSISKRCILFFSSSSHFLYPYLFLAHGYSILNAKGSQLATAWEQIKIMLTFQLKVQLATLADVRMKVGGLN